MDGVYGSEFEDSWEWDPQLNDINLASGQTVQDQHNNSTQISTTKSDPMKEQAAEVLMKKLKKRGVPEEDWSYYLKSSHTWDYNIKSESGLCKGIEVVLFTPTTSKPLWVDKSSSLK